MASLLGVSRQTIYNKIKRHNISYVGRFSDHDDKQLKAAITNITTNNPNAEEAMIQGHLWSQGISVQRKPLRSTLVQWLTNPGLGTMAHQRLRIKRQYYSVLWPNYLWHIDGNHKLVRWGIILHHGIDGFSRFVVFGCFSDNNRTSTVHQLFTKAIEIYRYPFRIRTDYGRENIEIWQNVVAK